MPAERASERLTAENGINESVDPTQLGVGEMQSILNWVPEANGALRARAKWFKGSETNLPTERRNKGMGTYQRLTDPVIVQTSTVYQQAETIAMTAVTPLTTQWPTPTKVGNTIIGIVTLAHRVADITHNVTITSTDWTEVVPMDTAITIGEAAIAVYMLETTQSYSGTFAPFTLQSSVSTIATTKCVFIELAGVTDLDVTGAITTAAASGAVTTMDIAMTASATTQDSELELAFVHAYRYQGSVFTTANNSLSTTTTGWSEHMETGQTSQFAAARSTLGIYRSTPRLIETPAVTVTSTFANEAADISGGSGVIITFKGWNPTAAPERNLDLLFAANDDGATYDIWHIPRQQPDIGDWTEVDSGLGDSTDGEPVSFANGLGALWYTSPSFSGVRRYDGAATTIQYSPAGARAVLFYRNRIWAAGSTTSPSRLYHTEINDGTTWTDSPVNTGSGYWEVSRDDGEAIEDVDKFFGMLVITKRTSVHTLTGRYRDEFALEQMAGGGGAPGKSICPTPFGCIIAGREMVYLFDGQTVVPIGKKIEQSYHIGEDEFVWCDYNDGSVYITAGSQAKTYVFNMIQQTWRIEQIGDNDATSEASAVMFSYGPTQFYGPVAGLEGSLANYRTFPNPTRGMDFDSLGMVFSAQSGDIPFGGARRPITPRQLYTRLRQHGGDESQTGLSVTPVFDGEDGGTVEISAGEQDSVRRLVADGFPQKAGVATVGVRFEQTIPAGESSVLSIEECYLDFIAEEART